MSFLRYFAPRIFADGHRLAENAPQLWKALVELTPDSARKHFEFPMQHVAKTVEEMLFKLARGEEWDEVTSYESWLNGLAKNNFSNHMHIISTAG